MVITQTAHIFLPVLLAVQMLWAGMYEKWAKGYVAWGGRAWLAPFPKMNGDWVLYGHDPVAFL